jgi:hypothetical protein
VSGPAGPFRAVHRTVGRGEELVGGRGALGADRDPGARGDPVRIGLGTRYYVLQSDYGSWTSVNSNQDSA